MLSSLKRLSPVKVDVMPVSPVFVYTLGKVFLEDSSFFWLGEDSEQRLKQQYVNFGWCE